MDSSLSLKAFLRNILASFEINVPHEKQQKNAFGKTVLLFLFQSVYPPKIKKKHFWICLTIQDSLFCPFFVTLNSHVFVLLNIKKYICMLSNVAVHFCKIVNFIQWELVINRFLNRIWWRQYLYIILRNMWEFLHSSSAEEVTQVSISLL
jgi:hypothetical protein